MRLFSWYGIAVLTFAAGFGYVAGAANRPAPQEVQSLPPTPSREEEAFPPPRGLAFQDQRIAPPEVIDLTSPPYVLLPFDLCAQTVEPPSADSTQSGVRQTSFEVPAGSVTPPFMPYLEDPPSQFLSGKCFGNFTCDLDIPIKSTSFQYGTPPFCNARPKNAPQRAATEIALGYPTWEFNTPDR